MTDTEKLKLIKEILATCWDTEPVRGDDERGHYRAMLNAIAVVVDTGARK